jgi:drug/metabolite transporter (DMT)-like permease
LVFAALWGYVIWHEQPSPTTTLGALIIVAAGLLASWPIANNPNKKGW